jgi:hypothetical protein
MLWESQDDIDKAFINYFNNLFTLDTPYDMEECLRATKRRVTADIKYSTFERVHNRGGWLSLKPNASS